MNRRGESLPESVENRVVMLGDWKATLVNSKVFGVVPKENNCQKTCFKNLVT